MACWFRAVNDTANQRLIDLKQIANPLGYYSIGLGGATAGKPLRLIKVSNASSVQITTTTTGYLLNTWQHACGVFSSATSRTIYLDAGGNATGANNLGAATAELVNIGVFSDQNNALSQYFHGLIAEVGIWNAALTAAEIASLAKGMTCDKVRPQSLVFYAPLVRDLNDQKGGLTITNNNGATVANHTRVYA
jgi:hypothetical protein